MLCITNLILRTALVLATLAESGSHELSGIPQRGYPAPDTAIGTLAAGDGVVYQAEAIGVPPKQSAFFRDTGDRLAWDPEATGHISAMFSAGTNFFLTGWFASFRQGGGNNYTARRSLARVDRWTGKLSDWDASIFGTTIEGLPIIVNATVIFNNLIFAGGTFTKVGTIPRFNLAAIDMKTAMATEWKVDIGRWDTLLVVNSLALDGDRLIIGGNFGSVAGLSRTNLAIVDVNTAEVKPFNKVVINRASPNHSGYVGKVAVRNGILYLAGDFTHVDDIPRAGLAAIDLATDKVTDWNPNPNGLVKALLLADDAIYVGGKFGSVGGTNRANLAALSYTTGQALDWNPSPNDAINAMVYDGGKLFVGGAFTQVGTNAMPYLAVFAEKGAFWFGGLNVTNGIVNARLFAEEGKTYLVESSTNFAQWTEVKRSQPANGSFEFTDPVASTAKYYRARALP